MGATRSAFALLLLAVIARSASSSSCILPPVEIWPPSGTVPRNSIWVIEFPPSMTGTEAFLEKLQLIGDEETIVFTSRESRGRQFLLSPATPLRPGTAYRMPWPVPGETAPPLGTWMVSEGEDREPPAFRRQVSVQYRYRADTCGGTGRWARFDVDATELSLAAVTITTRHEMFLPLTGATELYSGSSLCGGGNFSFRPLLDRYTGSIRLLDVAGNWSDEQPFTFDTTAEMRPLHRTKDDVAADRLPSPRRDNELFSDEQWRQAARFLAETFTAKRTLPRAFVPYDASLLQRWTFLGMPEESVRFILGRGGQPTDFVPPFVGWSDPIPPEARLRYDYLMVPPPAGHHVWLKLGISRNDEGRWVVVGEEFAPCLYADLESQREPERWEMCSPYGSTGLCS